MGWHHKLLTAFLNVSLLLILLSLTKHFYDWKQDSKTVENRLSQTPFFIAHVFDPSIDGLSFLSWSPEEWTKWLRRRDASHVQANPDRRRALIEKGINSVILANPNEFQNAFRAQRTEVSPTNGYFWSETRFSSIVFSKNNKGIQNVYLCPPMYIQVKFVKSIPHHLHVHATCRNEENVNSCRSNLKRDCVLVQ